MTATRFGPPLLGFAVLCILLLAPPVRAQEVEPAPAAPAMQPPVAPAVDAVPALSPIERSLRGGWNEFGLTNWEIAERLFNKVKDDTSSATPSQRLEARIGLLFITQYRQPGYDPAAAYTEYKKILQGLAEDSDLRSLLLAQMGACQTALTEPDMEKARTHFAEALAAPGGRPVIKQNAVLNYARTFLVSAKEEDLVRCLAVLEHYMPLMQGSPLQGVAHQAAGSVALSLGDYKRAVAELKAWDRAGILNITMRGGTLYQIARISEVELKDMETARTYYLRLYREVPSDGKAYWAKQRAAEIAAGKENAFAREPVRRLPARDLGPEIAAAKKVMGFAPAAPAAPTKKAPNAEATDPATPENTTPATEADEADQPEDADQGDEPDQAGDGKDASDAGDAGDGGDDAATE